MEIKAIKNVNIITMNKNKEIIEKGVVVVKDNLIAAIGDDTLLNEYSLDNIIDGENGILMPGMINCHTHASMIVFRSLGDDVPNRLKKYIFPLEKLMVNRKLTSVGAEYGIIEMLLSGVTSFVDMYYYEDEVAKAAKKYGIRAILGETVLDFPSPDSNNPYGGLEYGVEFIKKWKDDNLIIPAIAPHAPYTNDTKHLIMANEIACQYDVPLIMHVAEMQYEYEKYKEEYNMTPVQYLESIGILSERLLAAHAILVTDKDIDLLEQKRVGISHNIGANSKGAKGVAPLVKMYSKGMKIGLGTDGPMSGNTLDILTQMSLVGKIHKLFNKDRSIFPASQIVEMATIGGARALNLEDKIGSIEVGKKADLVILETKSINMQPIYDYYSVLVYSANASNVDTVIVDGKIIVQNKKLVNHNINDTLDKVKDIKRKILNVANKL